MARSVNVKIILSLCVFLQVPEGEEQPSSGVDLFISTERIKIVSSENKVNSLFETLLNHFSKKEFNFFCLY